MNVTTIFLCLQPLACLPPAFKAFDAVVVAGIHRRFREALKGQERIRKIAVGFRRGYAQNNLGHGEIRKIPGCPQGARLWPEP